MMTDWYQKAIDALQLNGLGERTQEAYVRAVRMLCQFYDKTPDQISESELQQYFLHRKNRDGWSPNTMRICYCGIRFFFVHVVQRNWHTLELIRAQSEHRLPVVLSHEEVRRLLGCVRTPHNRVFLSTVYACGLRLQEAQCLEVSDIDSERMMIHVHRGKGAKDRYVPLPQTTLARLRVHWKTHRNPRLLFPALGRSGQGAHTASTPMAKASVQGALRQARVDAGIHKQQMDRQLPGHHFMLTFTVPEPLRAFIYHHQPVAYNALYNASAEAIKTLALDPKHLGADLPGFFGVLHTWGRQLQYHPHIHYVVSGGDFSSEDHQWHPASPGFFLPVKTLSKRYRATFRDLMAKAGLLGQIPAEVWETDWNVNCQAVGASEGAVKYLAPYVFKAAISDSRIVKVENDQVTFRYRQPHSHRERTMTLHALEFIRRFLQHVLPCGLMKVRYYGFLHPSGSIPWAEVKARIEMTYGFALVSPEAEPLVTTPITCRCCGGTRRYLGALLPFGGRASSIIRKPAMAPSG